MHFPSVMSAQSQPIYQFFISEIQGNWPTFHVHIESGIQYQGQGQEIAPFKRRPSRGKS